MDWGRQTEWPNEELPGYIDRIELPPAICQYGMDRQRKKVYAKESDENQKENKDHLHRSLSCEDCVEWNPKEERGNKAQAHMEPGEAGGLGVI